MLYTFWTAQSQYAGYIIAEEEGLYKKEGLDLRVIHYDGTPSVTMLRERKTDFVSLTLLDALDARKKGVDLVNIFQLTHQSSYLVVSRDKPLRSLKDLEGKDVVTNRSFNSTLRKEITRRLSGNVTISEVYACVQVFLAGAYDYIICTSYHELCELEESGFRINMDNVLKLGENGFDIPEDGIYVLRSFLEENPTKVEKFVKASAEGWKRVTKDPEHSLPYTLERMARDNVVRNRYHERRMVEVFTQLQGKDNDFKLRREEFERAAAFYSEEFRESVNFESFVR
ncbi:MAG: ABC transporter substrate-binding protein [Bacteroidales bacterium]|nr:ABC transporter substrate-binding protein [Bacteroidales bacterium]